jgi:hypothetical protein
MPSNKEPQPATWTRYWPEFETLMKARLEAGAREYGDRSFRRPPSELVTEIEEEVLDIVGWAFMLWVRVRALNDMALVVPQPPDIVLQQAVDYLNADLESRGIRDYRVDVGKLATALGKD